MNGIQGKDVRNVNINNFLAPSFGIQILIRNGRYRLLRIFSRKQLHGMLRIC